MIREFVKKEIKKNDYLIIRCNDKKCFKDTSKKLNCEKCKKGKLYIKCFNCGKENLVISYFLRIDCTCGANLFPCAINKYKLIKNGRKK